MVDEDESQNVVDESQKKKWIRKTSKEKGSLTREALEKMTQEELIEQVLRLETHNSHLKNIIQKNSDGSNSGNNKEQSTKKKKKKFDFDKVSKRHVLLKFYYLGWDCQGYVAQENTCNTIEFHMFKALEQSCLIENRESSNYHRCGRTDKGVSSFSQVISIDLRSKLPEPNPENVSEELPYCSMLNRLLPDNIRCYAWSHADPNISARFDCSSRTYKYFFPKGDIDISLMKEGAKYLVGSHDFRNFCKMDVCNGVTEFQRTINSIEIQLCNCFSEEISGYQMYELVIEAKGFLWHQIRCIMTILILVGQKKESPKVVEELLDIERHPRKPQYFMANEVPLNLFNVSYDSLPLKWISDDEELKKIIELLQSQSTFHCIKTTMIREMIEGLEALRKDKKIITRQVTSLLGDQKSKIYKPLLNRMTCDSLEDRIDHYVKKRKLVLKEQE